MSDLIKGVQVGSEVKQYDYDALGNKPNLVQVDDTLSKKGLAADAKVVGDKFTAVEQSITNAKTELQKTIDQSVNAGTNAYANAIKGTASGAIVYMDDVSPVEHNTIVKVRGKNLFNKNSYVVIDNVLMFDISKLKIGKEYVLTSNLPITWFKISNNPAGHNSVSYSNANGMYEIQFVMERNKNIPADSTQYLLLSVNPNFASNAIKSIDELDAYNIQIEEGTVASEYTPYLDPSTICVKRCKKNLLKNTAVSQTTDGIRFSMDNDGGVVCYGTSTQYVFLTIPIYLTAGKYILSGCPSGGSEETYSNIFNAGNDVYYYDTGNGVEFEVAEDGEYGVYLCRFCPGVTVNGAVFKPMIRVVDCTDDNFEPYSGDEYIPNPDGTVSDITSLSPNMTILTDTDGAIVECEYNRNTNAVIKKLTDAIVALGGTV